MLHRNIPIFIPHLGCPNQCVFCNQRSISGTRVFQEADVQRQIEAALATIPPTAETEIAFFGGSFTGIDRGLMLRLLDTAQRYVEAGRVRSIRLSTRPDYIDGAVLRILSGYAVRVIELGLQSMNEDVLRESGRGHTAKQAEEACQKILEAGFALVGQMMIGLPAATMESECETAQKICDMGAEAARIYPTVVFRETPLCEMMQKGLYRPLTVDEAVVRSANALEIFVQNEIPCIRIGLCATEDLRSSDHAVAGPNHAALGELVWNELYYRRLYREIGNAGLFGQTVELSLPYREISKYVGQRRCNLQRLLRETDTRVVKTVGERNLNGAKPKLYREEK